MQNIATLDCWAQHVAHFWANELNLALSASYQDLCLNLAVRNKKLQNTVFDDVHALLMIF